LVVDHRTAAWVEAGDMIIPRDQGLLSQDYLPAEIGEIAAGKHPGRQSDDEITFFKSVGNGVQDNVVARRIVEKARRMGLGAEVSL